MRIAFVDQYSDFGGAQLCLGDVLTVAAERGWKGELWAPGDGRLHQHAHSCGVRSRALPLREYSNGQKSVLDAFHFAADVVRSWALLNARFREERPDLLYVNGPRALPLVVGHSIPTVFHSHSVLDKGYTRWIARRCLQSIRAEVIVSSDFLARPLRDLVEPRSVRVIYNGVPEHVFRSQGPASGPIHVGMVGRIAPEKGHLDFLKAIKALQGVVDVQPVIVGTEMFGENGYAAQVQSAGNALGVRFSGWLEPKHIYSDLDVLAVPSAAHDANPRVIMEAMAAGTCVVAYRSGGIPELIRDGHDGIIVERNPFALAQGIARLATDDDLRRSVAENARQTYSERFTVQRFQQEICDAILGTLGGPVGGSIESHCESQVPEPADDRRFVSR